MFKDKEISLVKEGLVMAEINQTVVQIKIKGSTDLSPEPGLVIETLQNVFIIQYEDNRMDIFSYNIVEEVIYEKTKPEGGLKLIERWEERIYRITEVIHVDNDGESFGAPSYKDEELHDVTDSGENSSEDFDKLASDHWIHGQMKREEGIKP